MLRNGQRVCAHAIRAVVRCAIQGIASLYAVVPVGCALRRGIRRDGGGVCQGAVATPVFGWLRPPNPLCTPIVASRVATARLTIKF